jgi:biopolymer transport protein ExbB
MSGTGVAGAREALAGLLALGGPVVAVLLALSVLVGAVTLYKLWEHRAAGVGRHAVLREALAEWDAGRARAAVRTLEGSRSHLAPIVEAAMLGDAGPGETERLEAEASLAFGRLEGGFRVLDSVAQVAPLLGLFGTVLGMIEAFRGLQEAGSAVDPSILAGGIWVALLTTAVGLAVAMPTALILAWLEDRMARERAFADLAIRTVLAPRGRAARAEASGDAALGQPA